MAKNKKSKTKEEQIENLCSDETPDICFQDNPIITGKEVASFSFSNSNTEEDISPIPKEKSIDIPLSKSKATFKRSYMLTEEAIRKVDELKVHHPNLTTYVSEIVESAINYYYDYVFNSENSNK